jgi:hypothetical protein
MRCHALVVPCKTKPIPVRPELDLNPLQKKIYTVCARLTGSAKQSQFPLRCRLGDRRSREAKLAKQSQFGRPGGDRVPLNPAPRAVVQTKPICRRARKWALDSALQCQSCQTKPIGSPWRPYKQSQFAAGTCRARACPELAEGTPDPRSGRGQAPRRVEGDRAKQSQFRSTAGETLRLQASGQDLQCWQRLGIALVRTSHGEREL